MPELYPAVIIESFLLSRTDPIVAKKNAAVNQYIRPWSLADDKLCEAFSYATLLLEPIFERGGIK